MIQRTEECLAGTAGNCLITAWTGGMNVESVRMADAVAQELEERYPQGILMLVILASVTLLDADQKQLAGAFYAKHGPHLRGVANVVLGTGFWAGAVRAVLIALRVFSPMPYPMSTFSSTSSALRWLERHGSKQPLRGPEVDRIMREVSALLGDSLSLRPESNL